MKIAHKTDTSEQSIYQHAEGVARKASEFANEFGFNEYAYTTGLLHDIGKYSDKFQKKIKTNTNVQVDHATAGARELANINMLAGSMAVAGHHGGIPNGTSNEDSCWRNRVKNKVLEDYSDYKGEIIVTPVKDPNYEPFVESFFVRMLYSCLVDADYLDTEEFMNNEKRERGLVKNISTLYKDLMEYINKWLVDDECKSTINKYRTQILKNCIQKGKSSRGVFSLTVPTGGGKTIASMAFALTHAMEHNKEHPIRRIIYVIPYTSIIEQNAKVFCDIFGQENVLQHHSNYDDIDMNKDEIPSIHQLSTQNWDHPLIVTTNVQFFESIYSNKPSKCRKLHNIANSVVIFDEAQMIPLNYMKPCVKAISELVERYGVTAVLCTATQPALNRLFEPMRIKEICDDYQELFRVFKRNKFKYVGKISEEQLINIVSNSKQGLVIVNTKEQAKNIFLKMNDNYTYHLSTNMTPNHREGILEVIRKKIENHEECRVISTSLIEAGVDLSFETVYREQAGLDSIIQAGGRCNREGVYNIEDSIVGVFEFEQNRLRVIEKNIAMMKESVNRYGDYDALEAIEYYFTQLQLLDKDYLDQYHIIEAFEKHFEGMRFPFAAIAE